ncbi:MAG: SDR family NAD(P)-dependent oxidoreductase [Actinomycetota bacterium]|nr:SDR family NAD(P)-dependent oxidoreductase [Actinomycetota bacterium]
MPRLADLNDDALREEVETKVLGYLRCIRAAAPLMAAQGWGRVINISGLNARQATSLVGSERNVAVAAMTENLADELGPAGINVTVVHPGRR